MRTRTLTSSASAVLLFTASLVSAKHGHAHEHLQAITRRHDHRHLARSAPDAGEQGIEIRAVPETAAPETVEKRDGQCAFPYDAGLVAVTPGSQNAGWAMSPDQPCKPGNYCPYACPPGQVMAQWDPSATSYSYPKSMNGGLYCDNSGSISKPFPDKPYCESTNSNIGVINNAGGVVSFCQTVLPGNEAMLIPTEVSGYATLAAPGPDYWCGTAAHYYINPPGTGAGEGCVWGSKDSPVGNWSPYVAGTNVDDSGQTFIKLGWNPIYLEPMTPFRDNMPDWGVKIDCPDGGCNGLPCAIDPSENRVNQMRGSRSNGAGGGAFCVVTVDKGSTANFVITGSGGGNGGQFYDKSSSEAAPSSTSSWDDWSSSSTYSSEAPSSTWSASSSWSAPSSESASWSVGNSTSSYGAASTGQPTHSPKHTLFDTVPASTVEATTQLPSATLETPVIAEATGAASAQSWSRAGVIVAVLAAAARL